VNNRRDVASRLPDLDQIADRLEPLRRSRPAIPLLYVEFERRRDVSARERKREEAQVKRASASAVRASLGKVLRKGDIAAAGPGAQWFVVLLVARARRAKALIHDADLGVAAERLGRSVKHALDGVAHRNRVLAVRCGWTVLELEGASSREALRQAVRGAAVVARIEERRATTLAAVTHELRTPLTAIVGFAERLRDPRTDERSRARAIEIIADEAQRLARLTEGLIDIGAWSAGHLDLRCSTFDLGVLARSAVESIADHARSKDLRVAVKGRARVTADPDRCFQVLLNLLDNAVRHSPRSGAIDVRIQAGCKHATVTVHDEGPGLPVQVRSNLGRPFVRGVDGRVGLGLAISKVLVEAHGGTLGVGEGRLRPVVVTLPLRPAQPPTRIPQDRTSVCE
jgi:signal transduction histidine kinase